MFKNVVVSLDGSEPSSRALMVAADLAQRYDAHLTIVHAILADVSLADLVEVAKHHGFLDQISADLDKVVGAKALRRPVSSATFVAVPTDVLARVGQLLLEESASKARAIGLKTVETALLGGDAAREILDFVETNEVDLIICGTRGLGGLKRFLLGSVSQKLLQEAKCSSLVVK